MAAVLKRRHLPPNIVQQFEHSGRLARRIAHMMDTRLGVGLLALALLLPASAAPALAEDAAARPSLPEPRDAAVRARERAAMIAFYAAMGGPDWIQRDFWGSD